MRTGFFDDVRIFATKILTVASLKHAATTLFISAMLVNVSASPSTASTWDNQTLTFNYYFPNYGNVFAGSPITFVADGSLHLSTFANLSPATFSVVGIGPDEVQISYDYPIANYPNGAGLTVFPFNGFNISGPNGLSPIISAFVDSNSNVTGLTDSDIGFTANSVSVNLAGDVFPPGSVGLIDIQFARAVPEPSTWAMMMLGFCGFGFLLHRRRSSALGAA